MEQREQAVTLARQSKARNDGSEASTETQQAKCHELARLRGWDVVADFADIGASGYQDKVSRPGLDAALAAIRRGEASRLIVYKLDRLTRKGVIEAHKYMGEIIAAGGELVSVQEQFLDTSTPIGRGIFGLIAALAEQESANISARSSGAKATLRRAGSASGGPVVFGMESYSERVGSLSVRRLRPHPADGPVLLDVVERVLAGESVRSLVADLNSRGIRTRRGAEWAPSTLTRVLRSPAIGGYMPKWRQEKSAPHIRDGRVEIERDEETRELVQPWEGVVDGATFARLQDALDARALPRGLAKKASLFGGFLLVCGHCGGPMQAERRDSSPGGGSYRCSKHRRKSSSCDGTTVALHYTDTYVADVVLRRLPLLDPKDEADAALLLEATKRYAGRLTVDGGRGPELRALIADGERALEQLDDDRTAGVFEGESGTERYRRQARAISERVATARAELAEIEAADAPLIPWLEPEILGEDPLEEGGYWQSLSIEDQRGMLALFLDRVRVIPTESQLGHGGNATWRGRERLALEWAGEDAAN
ncbi:recombinase family protein [Flexivirga sp.]|uniref:recombinase family protein n=1 Tax=Flexivirga sp. TaxID=1962927 RepID=UPI003F81E83D